MSISIVDEKKKVVNSILKAIAISGVLLATVIYIRMRPPEHMKIDFGFPVVRLSVAN